MCAHEMLMTKSKYLGLTQGNSEGGGGGTKSQSSRNPSSAPVSNSSRSYVKRPPPPQSSGYQSQHYAQAPADDDIQEVTPVVKTEAAAVSSASVAAGGGYGAEEGGGGVMAEYEDTYGDYGDPGYGDQEYDTSMMDQDQGMAGGRLLIIAYNTTLVRFLLLDSGFGRVYELHSTST